MNESVEKLCCLGRIVGPGDVSAIVSTPSAVPQPPPPTKSDTQDAGALTTPSPPLSGGGLSGDPEPCFKATSGGLLPVSVSRNSPEPLTSPVSSADHPRFPRITTRATALTIHPAGICGEGGPKRVTTQRPISTWASLGGWQCLRKGKKVTELGAPVNGGGLRSQLDFRGLSSPPWW